MSTPSHLNAQPLVWGHGPRTFEVFLEPTCPYSVRAFNKLDDLLDEGVGTGLGLVLVHRSPLLDRLRLRAPGGARTRFAALVFTTGAAALRRRGRRG